MVYRTRVENVLPGTRALARTAQPTRNGVGYLETLPGQWPYLYAWESLAPHRLQAPKYPSLHHPLVPGERGHQVAAYPSLTCRMSLPMRTHLFERRCPRYTAQEPNCSTDEQQWLSLDHVLSLSQYRQAQPRCRPRAW